jgi:hypothetical protein
MTEQDRIAKGHRAAKELRETDEAFAKLEAQLIEQWKSASPGHVDLKERLHAAVWTLNAVRTALRAVVDDGAIATQALAQANLLRP